MQISQTKDRYVLITPARNEQAFLERTIEGVLSQSVKPLRWIIVDDRSSDNTAQIVSSHLLSCDFLRLLKITDSGGRHFGHKANAFNAAVRSLSDCDYEFIGNLDADIALPPQYYERVLAKFESDPTLGLAGGSVETKLRNGFVSLMVAPDSVSGAVQLFRRACFEQIGGGYLALERGGIDAAAEVVTRMKGWRVRSFQEITVRENRYMGTANHRFLRSRMNEGARFHSLGYDTTFFLLRAIYRMKSKPYVIGSLGALIGFLAARLRREPIALSSEVVAYLQNEQRTKLKMKLAKVLPFFQRAKTEQLEVQRNQATGLVEKVVRKG